jgi:DNA-binding MarR family transcriptional regulator
METRWLDEREQFAWRGLRTMVSRLDAELARRLSSESDLSLQDYALLVVLSEQPDRRLRPSALAEELGWERSRLSHHVSRMERRHLVKKEVCPEDGRGSFVVATPQGLDSLSSAAPGHVDAVRELFIDRLSGDQLDALGRLTHEIIDGLDQPPS